MVFFHYNIYNRLYYLVFSHYNIYNRLYCYFIELDKIYGHLYFWCLDFPTRIVIQCLNFYIAFTAQAMKKLHFTFTGPKGKFNKV